MKSQERIAFYPGSFDPFTIGHQSIVLRALKMFDRVVIGVGVNPDKIAESVLKERLEAIQDIFLPDKVSVLSFTNATVDIATDINASCIIRGVRGSADFEYEQMIAEVNRQLTGIETVFLLSEPQLAHISSSVVRELQRLGKDVSAYLPQQKKKTV